jgi:HD-GYP domain-containing protein (c-di-GMP phosphodiesterase class II)
LDLEERFEELDEASGGQLDPGVVEALKTVLEERGFLEFLDSE